MSVAVVTSRGAFVVDLFLKSAPMNGFNFLKLCKVGWFDNAVVLEIMEGLFARIGQVACPKGQTVYELSSGDANFYVHDEINRVLTHSVAGMLSTCNEGPDLNNSNFFITLGGDLSGYDGKRTIFGEIGENWELIKVIAKEPIDRSRRPLRNVRILETRVLVDPFDDPPGFGALQKRFVGFERIREDDRIEDEEEVPEIDSARHKEAMAKWKAQQNAEILEMMGDLPDANARPPEVTIFVCKLNPVTHEEGLNVFFSRFGHVESVKIMRDKQTGESLRYAFVTFEKPASAENAFLKGQRAVIDGRQICVDFSQSVRETRMKYRNESV